MLWHAYVDESGDRGWKPSPPNLPPGKRGGSSRIFSASAVLVPDGIQSQALTAWEQAAIYTNRPAGALIHWHDLKSTGQRKLFTSTVAQVPGVQVISVVLCKWHLENVSTLRNPGYLYNWTLRLLVERISWFAQHRNVRVKMTFSQVQGLPNKTLMAYLHKLQTQRTFIQWRHLLLPPRIDTPRNRRMLQLADTASASVFAAFEPDLYGFSDQSYLELLKPVLWRRSDRPLQKDGIKFGPWASALPAPPATCQAEYPWLVLFCS